MNASAEQVVAFMSKHFVAMLVGYESYNSDGSLYKKADACYSGFLIELYGIAFWVTAGHCLKDDIDAKVMSGQAKITGGAFMDCFNLGAKHKHSIPHRYEPGQGFYVEEPEEGLDYALIMLNELEKKAFAANGVEPITRANWIHQERLSFDFYRMLGIPKDRVFSTPLPNGSLDTKVGQALLAINAIGVDEVGERPPEQVGKRLDDWFIGRIDPKCGIDSIEGMSGGPIYGFRTVDGKSYYHIVALQSRWWPGSRTIFGCSLTRFAEEVYRNIGPVIEEVQARRRMSDEAFVMTYPCYFLNTKGGNPESVIVDGNRCLCLFTDKDLVESFYRDKYGPQASATIEVTAVGNQENLILLLEEWWPVCLEQDCGTIAIDPSPGRQVGYVGFDELVGELKRQGDTDR